jgi:hypothetical protein
LVVEKHRGALILGSQYGMHVCAVAFAALEGQTSPSIVLLASLSMHSLDQAEPLVFVTSEASLPELDYWDKSGVSGGIVQNCGIAPVAIRTGNALLPVHI